VIWSFHSCCIFRAEELKKREDSIASQRKSLAVARTRHKGQTDAAHRTKALEVVVYALKKLNTLLVENKEEPEEHTDAEAKELNPPNDDPPAPADNNGAPDVEVPSDGDDDDDDDDDDDTPPTDPAAGDNVPEPTPADIMGDLASKESENADKESESKVKPAKPNRVLDELNTPLTPEEMDDL
jgi:hypothetical protein